MVITSVSLNPMRDVHLRQRDVRRGASRVRQVDDSPRLTLKLALSDFIRLIFNQADGTQLFMTGKMKLQGDMMFEMQMQGMFQQPGS